MLFMQVSPKQLQSLKDIGLQIRTEKIHDKLPIEITFVDKNNVFKYFNTITESSDMMLVHTPTPIGKNVADCHSPRSLNKVMKLIRDLKSKKRQSENMWFKKGLT